MKPLPNELVLGWLWSRKRPPVALCLPGLRLVDSVAAAATAAAAKTHKTTTKSADFAPSFA